jgi:hypothetical protein
MAGIIAEAGAAEEAALITSRARDIATCAFPFGRQSAKVVVHLNTSILRLCARF